MQNTGSPQQFCLRWNNYQSNLTNVFDQLLQSESFVDVTLACDGHSVKAHKMVLSACSPYFQSLFFENPCQHPIVIMRDIKWPELKAAVEFMYKGEINVSQEQIGPLLKVAESLKIRGLADVNGEQDLVAPEIQARELGDGPPLIGTPRPKKRRRPSGERSSGLSSPSDSVSTEVPEPPPPTPTVEMSPAPPPTPTQQQQQPGGQVVVTPQQSMATVAEPMALVLPVPPPPPPPQSQQATLGHGDDLEIKPGIAEMIREEERVSVFFKLFFPFLPRLLTPAGVTFCRVAREPRGNNKCTSPLRPSCHSRLRFSLLRFSTAQPCRHVCQKRTSLLPPIDIDTQTSVSLLFSHGMNNNESDNFFIRQLGRFHRNDAFFFFFIYATHESTRFKITLCLKFQKSYTFK